MKARLAVHHSDCGGLLGYVSSPESEKRQAKDFFFPDGRQPIAGDSLEIECTKCRKTITEFKNMTAHIFDEWE